MRVKRTKSGKFSLEVTQLDRLNVFDALGQLMDEPTELNRINLDNELSILTVLYYTILINMFQRIDPKEHLKDSVKWVITRAEAIALMWFLRKYDHNMQMLDMKASLHKHLQG